MCLRSKLVPWTPPRWVPSTVKVPSSKCVLANVPTPIEKWNLKDFGDGKQQFFIKRDDLTGTSLTGNKIRKLEFLLADAIEKGCDTIIAWGASTSNHCRSTAVACAELGLECHLLLTSNESEITYDSGNITLAALSGAHMYKMETCSFDEADKRMENLSSHLAKSGKKAYIIPRDGVKIEDLIDITDDYVGKGYGDAWPELKELILEVAQSTGIFLDRVYTGKAIYAIKEELIKNPERFAGDKILFLHTGGLFGVTDGSLTSEIIEKRKIIPFPSELTSTRENQN
ncbi:Oidioi.mRNA.OKI2018_I69.XSR.g15343.t1.cds [Oikopleura dioica]|uniref:Oidioi.mRNA.OKI2018_I69.XSR.g15343.t1.cds n=1 Tax=Oikopleura dioica TaxID=34765 RepID=A0ABN7SLS0_OIKDI|nr:Oidioi.mRNA.OKI2018_I69.XSR.g15343.t1.cds [Oikopleura dioica]